MTFLGSLLRQGTEFGLGAIQGGRDAETQAAEDARQREREVLEQAMLRSQIGAQDALAQSRMPQPDPGAGPRADFLGTQENLSPEQSAVLNQGGQPFQSFFESTLKPPEIDAPDPEIEARRADLIARGASPSEAAAMATSPSLYADFVERASGAEAGDVTGQRQRALAAARAIQAIQEEITGNTFKVYEPGEVNQRIQAALRPFGYNSVDEVARDMEAFGVAQPDAIGGGQPVGTDDDPLGIRN